MPYLKETSMALQEYGVLLHEVQDEISRVIIGQKALVQKMLIALMGNGHILLEGVPGLAKTKSIATLAKILGVKFQRIQFTPDLLPSDLIGNRIYNQKDHSFSVKKGPIFANFILADEINRAPAKVQSALLEAMQEYQVTIGEETFPLEKPFFVLATQNPIEQEGTYPLPEAQVDRFFLKVRVGYPSESEEVEIMNTTEFSEEPKLKKILTGPKIQELQKIVEHVYADEKIKGYIRDIVFASRFPEKYALEDFTRVIAFGASPRASIALLKAAKGMAFLNGREYVIPEDIKAIGYDVLRHRIIPTYEAEAENITSENIIQKIFATLQVP
ncbi:MoxR family ATPase [Candidatus Peregrinibacteria bacterium]|nr:MoxR family ATPase [Candidatus Peregrinibacteria bacterium]